MQLEGKSVVITGAVAGIGNAITMPPADPFGFGRTSELLVHSSLLGMPEDVANAVLFLAKDDSHFINGTVITVDGACG